MPYVHARSIISPVGAEKLFFITKPFPSAHSPATASPATSPSLSLMSDGWKAGVIRVESTKSQKRERTVIENKVRIWDAADADLGSICGRGTARATSVFVGCSDAGNAGGGGP